MSPSSSSSSSSSFWCLVVLLIILQSLCSFGVPSDSLRPLADWTALVSVAELNKQHAGPRLYRATHTAVQRISREGTESYEMLLDLVVRETVCGRGLENHLDQCALRWSPAASCSSLVQLTSQITKVLFLTCNQSGDSFSSESSEDDSLQTTSMETLLFINALLNAQSPHSVTLCNSVVDCARYLL